LGRQLGCSPDIRDLASQKNVAEKIMHVPDAVRVEDA
jgi:hypothetical protein